MFKCNYFPQLDKLEKRPTCCHCEERSDAATSYQTRLPRRFAPRNDNTFLLFIFALTVYQTTILFSILPSYAVGNPGEEVEASPTDSAKNYEDLLEEAQDLLEKKHPIDARAKLQQALQLNPKDFKVHVMLGQYYLFEVGHFQLAYRYIRTAEQLFEAKHGSDKDGSLDPKQSRRHASILYLRAEAELNLDRYQASLNTLDRFGGLYWTDWYPGTRAWVLMKLRRMDEAIKVAQAGLLQGADPRRTYNILGILFSITGNRELSLKAFAQSIASEMIMGIGAQVATPLNNAGEVYREIFKDNLAEASWLKAVKMNDGCEHILPSLNLAILYIDQLRLFQAERSLKDFEVCYAAQSQREDTEHRALLALARGRIALRSGRIDDAINFLTLANERHQWFGKIGTNENDLRLAATIALAQALDAKAETITDTAYESFKDAAQSKLQIPVLRVRAWWLKRQARNMAVEEMSDLEDLSVRNTDTMLEYPTIGSAWAGFPLASFRKRISRLIDSDPRAESRAYYRLYLAENLANHREYQEALDLLTQADQGLRPIDRLAKANLLALLIRTKQNLRHFWNSISLEEKQQEISYKEELFKLLPSQLRYFGLSLPVVTTFSSDTAEGKSFLEDIESDLGSRFQAENSKDLNLNYELRLSHTKQSEGAHIILALIDRRKDTQYATVSAILGKDAKSKEEIVNKFIASVFSHKVDPPGEPVPKLELLEGIM